MTSATEQSRVPFIYSNCQLTIPVKNKGLINDNLRYLYFKDDMIIVCKQQQEPIPYKQFKIEGNWLLKWIYTEKQEDQLSHQQLQQSSQTQLQPQQPQPQPQIIGFKLYERSGTKIMEYYGENAQLLKMKQLIQKKLFQVDFLRDFEIIEKVGSGKYAKVYKVQNKYTKEFCAVKYLNKKKLAEIEDGVESLFNELKILRSINNKYCIQFIGAYEDKNGYYILMELLDHNKCLQNEITKFQELNFDLRVTKLIIKQILLGIEYIHSQGIMHRDLKPQNIMFTLDNQESLNHLKIIDFGLAQFYNDPHFLYVHVGTPGFVAPEILANESENHRYGPKCDLFSVGIIFHILLTGKQVFPGKKFKQVLEKNKLCNIQLTGQEYEKISKDSMDLLQKLLEIDVKKRVSASEALVHPFFDDDENSMLRKRMPSMCTTNVDAYLQQQSNQKELGEVKQRKFSGQQEDKDIPNSLSRELVQKNMLIKIFYQLIKFLIMYYEQQKNQAQFAQNYPELSNQKRNRKFSIEDNYDEIDSPNDINFIRQFAKLNIPKEKVEQPQQLEFVRKLSFQQISQGNLETEDIKQIKQQINEQSPLKDKKLALAQNIKQPEKISMENQIGKQQNIYFQQPPAKIINEEEVTDGSHNTLKENEQQQVQQSPLLQEQAIKQKQNPNAIQEEKKSQEQDAFEMVVDTQQQSQNVELRQSNVVLSPQIQPKQTEEEQKQIILTRNWHQLNTVFPVESFLTIPKLEDVVYNMGIYLLFGYDLHKCNGLKDETVNKQLKEVYQSKIFDTWFVDLIQEMIQAKAKKSNLTLEYIEKKISQQMDNSQLYQINQEYMDK